MSISIAIEGTQIIAAMTPATSRAAFNRGQLIVRAADGTIVEARTYTIGDRVEASSDLTEDDVRELIEAGQAMEISPTVPLTSGAVLWVLRPGLPSRDQKMTALRTSGVLVCSPWSGPDDARLCVVKESEAHALELRKRWRDNALVAAKSWLERGDWQRAVDEAEIAQAVGGLDPEVLGLLSLAYERCGRQQRAQGLVTMARNSRGEEFAEQVTREIQRLRETLDAAGSVTRTRPHPSLRDALRQVYPEAARRLGQSCSARLPGLDDAAVA